MTAAAETRPVSIFGGSRHGTCTDMAHDKHLLTDRRSGETWRKHTTQRGRELVEFMMLDTLSVEERRRLVSELNP